LNDPEFVQWIPVLPFPYGVKDAEWFIDHASTSWEAGTEATFFICDGPTTTPVGGIAVHLAASDPGLASVGYWLERGARGRGLATSALRLVADWSFGTLGIARLHLTTLPDNVPSQRVAERTGFIREGVLRQWAQTREGRSDAVMYSLLAGDVAARPAR
jgi:RimJ/RimL family protein N-acetyltransferase